MDWITKPISELKTLNGINSTKIGGILMIFVSLFFFFFSEDGDKLRILSIVGLAIGAIWLLYAAGLGISILNEKGIRAYMNWEWANLGDSLLAANVKMLWQMLVLLGVGALLLADEFFKGLKEKQKQFRGLGIAALVIAFLYFTANLVIGFRILQRIKK